MAAFIMESADAGAGFNQSLAETLAKGVMPLLDGLHIATGIASALRELHHKGLVHGDVRAESVWVDAEEAILEPRGTRCGMADARVDVTAFGELLYEIFSGCKLPANAPPPPFTLVTVPASLDDIRQDAMRLGERCRAGALESKQALIELKILAIQARRLGAAVVSAASPAAPAMEIPAAVEETKPEPAAEESHGMLICPKCSGPAPKFLVRPHSIVEGMLNRIGPLRECELCGYRFVVIRIRRASH